MKQDCIAAFRTEKSYEGPRLDKFLAFNLQKIKGECDITWAFQSRRQGNLTNSSF